MFNLKNKIIGRMQTIKSWTMLRTAAAIIKAPSSMQWYLPWFSASQKGFVCIQYASKGRQPAKTPMMQLSQKPMTVKIVKYTVQRNSVETCDVNLR
jgi:hypothetical protein